MRKKTSASTPTTTRVDGDVLPHCLRIGMERLCGVPLNEVRVFYNASEPARVQAHAYAQGQNIYLAPGQDHHLPHELGHVVQQIKGMVKPTRNVNGIAINDNPHLERQASEWGELALRYGGCSAQTRCSIQGRKKAV